MTGPEQREAALVETVARAIRQNWLRANNFPDDWADASEETRTHYRRLAAAAIAAYRAQDGGAEEAVRLREALELIDQYGCENFTGATRCLDPHSGRTRGAQYGADAWCDPCIARVALEAAQAAATPGPWENPYPFTKLIDAPGSSDNLAIVQCDNATDAALIVAAVNTLPDLLAAARERDALRAGVEALLRDWQVGIEVLDTVDRFEAVDRLRALLADMGGGGQ